MVVTAWGRWSCSRREGGQLPVVGFSGDSCLAPSMQPSWSTALFVCLETHLSLTKEPLQFMEEHVCVTSFVVNYMKCFQSWEYALSSADTPVRAKKWDKTWVIGRAWTLCFLGCSCLAVSKHLVYPFIFSQSYRTWAKPVLCSDSWKTLVLKWRNCSVVRKHEHLTSLVPHNFRS